MVYKSKLVRTLTTRISAYYIDYLLHTLHNIKGYNIDILINKLESSMKRINRGNRVTLSYNKYIYKHSDKVFIYKTMVHKLNDIMKLDLKDISNIKKKFYRNVNDIILLSYIVLDRPFDKEYTLLEIDGMQEEWSTTPPYVDYNIYSLIRILKLHITNIGEYVNSLDSN